MNTETQPLHPIRRAIQVAGGQVKLARATGYSQQGVSKALRTGQISLEFALKIEAATGVPAAEIRPDLAHLLPPPRSAA